MLPHPDKAEAAWPICAIVQSAVMVQKPASIVFRTDAALNIGTGHVMRCLTLAQTLKEAGAECLFICRAHPGNLISYIGDCGFEVLPLPYTALPKTHASGPGHGQWLGAPWADDAAQTIIAIGDSTPDWLIVDHYAIEAKWERSLRPHCKHLMVIDDLADRPHECDLLLDQNLGREAADYSGFVDDGCQLLIGPAFALLRPEFAEFRAISAQRRAKSGLKKLLIAMGGVDQDNATGKVLNALKACDLPKDLQIDIVMGPQAPWINQIRQRAAAMPWKTAVHVNIKNMAQVMAESDLAIGAAGSTSWERCCLGLPSIVLVLAENQLPTAKALAAIGGAAVVPDLATIGRALPAILENLTKHNFAGLGKLGEISLEITDGSGTKNVLRHLDLAGQHG